MSSIRTPLRHRQLFSNHAQRRPLQGHRFQKQLLGHWLFRPLRRVNKRSIWNSRRCFGQASNRFCFQTVERGISAKCCKPQSLVTMDGLCQLKRPPLSTDSTSLWSVADMTPSSLQPRAHFIESSSHPRVASPVKPSDRELFLDDSSHLAGY